MSFVHTCFVVFVCAVVAVSAVGPVKITPPGYLVNAFQNDGFQISECLGFQSGAFGCVALSNHATTYLNGRAKRAYFLKGTGYEMGYLSAILAPEAVEAMTTTYLELLPLELVTIWVDKHVDNPEIKAIAALLRDLLETTVLPSFDKAVKMGQIPVEIQSEIDGVVDGALSLNQTTGATLKAVVTLNYGIDVLLSSLYADSFPDVLSELADSGRALRFGEFPLHIRSRARKLWTNPNWRNISTKLGCHAMGVSGKAITGESSGYFGRDFMLPCGTVFQLFAAHIIRVPVDGRYPTVGVSAPGMLGYIAVVNDFGVSFGVDVLRAGASDPKNPGYNSLMLMRSAAEHSQTLDQVVQYISNTPRGCSWLYPTCDGTGKCAVLETGASFLSSASPLSYVSDSKLRALLPSDETLLRLRSNAAYSNGVYVRHMNWTFLPETLDYNPKLFALGKCPYNTSSFTDPVGFAFKTFQDENHYIRTTMDNWFIPQRETYDDVVLTSNLAIIPEMRVATMNRGSNLLIKFDNTAPAWRYDQLNLLVSQAYGSINYETAWDIITYLSPNKTIGFYNDPTPPSNDPMTTMIEGSVSVVDLGIRKIRSQYGYWCDNYVETSLLLYLTS